MKQCQQCGAELSPDSNFCIQCGARVESDVTATPTPVTEHAQPPPTVAPPQPYPPHPPQAPYGYAQPPEAYAYAPPPPGYAPPVKKKKRWWIPVTIIAVIIAILAGSWFAFGDQIRSLFVSTEKRWQKAEQAFGLFPEGTLFSDIRESAEKRARQTKFGSITDLTVDLSADEMPDELAEIFAVLSGIRLHFEQQIDLDEQNPHFYVKAGLGKRGETGEILAAELYDTANHLVIDVPDLLPRALAMPKDMLGELMGDASDLDMPLDELINSVGAMNKGMGNFMSDKLDGIVDDLKAIFTKYADEPQFVKAELLTVGGVSQKLNYFDVELPAHQFAPMLKEMLRYLRENRDIQKLMDEMESGFGVGSALGQGELYDSFVDMIEETLEAIDDSPEDFKISVQRKLYVDKKNNPVGGEFILTKRDGSQVERVKMASLHVVDGSEHAQQFAFETPDDMGFDYVSKYTVNNGRYTGTYKIRLKDYDNYYDESYHDVAEGSFKDFALQTVGDELYPVGTVTIELKELDEFSYDAPQGLAITYEGRVEKSKLIATLQIAVSDPDMPLRLTLGIEHSALPPASLNFDRDLPYDYIDFEDEDALMELFEDDRIFENLEDIMERLGIDPDVLAGLGGLGFDDDDWYDDWDDFDFDD